MPSLMAMVNGCCTSDDCRPGPIPDLFTFLPQSSPRNVLSNLEVAYRTKQVQEYSRLLASDFIYYFDPMTRQQLGIEYWTRTEDSLRTEQLFTAPEVTRILIHLEIPGDTPVSGAGREAWRAITMTELFVQADYAPIGRAARRLRVEDQAQTFYFRRGLTSADTTATSSTSALWYLVEWHDAGVAASTSPPAGSDDLEFVPWSRLKTLHR